jgi:hypothetical protein
MMEADEAASHPNNAAGQPAAPARKKGKGKGGTGAGPAAALLGAGPD